MATKTTQEWIEELNEMDRELDGQIAMDGYIRGDLKRVFDVICNPTDWKAPIAAVVKGEMVLPAVAAIKFFTATMPTVALDVRTMEYAIESIGYRASPAGDH